MTTRHTLTPTPLGELMLVADGDELTGLYFPDHWYPPRAEAIGERVDAASDPVFAEAAAQLGEYLSGRRTEFALPVRTSGDDFQERVWALLRQIPYGETTSYGELAEQLGDRNQARRVGRAVGRNPVSIVIGCHRVVGKDGALTGYAGGLERKARLLELEAPDAAVAGRLF
jgi:methylated-DNA-[protein]-cysteine S-methyltransferase